MSGGTYTGYYDTPIALTSAGTTVTVTASGTIDVPAGNAIEGGTGNAYTVFNDGSIAALAGIGLLLNDGGSVTNGAVGAFIEGYSYGVEIKSAAGTVTNVGTIESTADRAGGQGGEIGVALIDGGSIVNGAIGNTVALIEAVNLGVSVGTAHGTLTNYGTIEGTRYGGVSMTHGDSLTNGAADSTVALIEGGTWGAYGNAVTNFGTIEGRSKDGVSQLNGTVANGAGDSSAALIEGGQNGIYMKYGTTEVTNFGTIEGTTSAGIYFAAGNGSVANDGTAAQIGGGERGVWITGTGTVTNDGTILGMLVDGVYLRAGTVANGPGGSTAALIAGGQDGVYASKYGSATDIVTNDGTILGTSGVGVILARGGFVTNGTSGDTAALIEGGQNGISLTRFTSATLTNFGTIEGLSADGVYMRYGSLTNGAGGSHTALIEGGQTGVDIAADGTVTNFGTIEGGTDAVVFSTASAMLVVEGGGTLVGQVIGGGGTLKLDSAGGTGTLSGLGSHYDGFAQYVVAAAATWTLTQANVIGSSGTLTNDGTLIIAGGALTVDTAVRGTGSFELLNHGTLELGAGASGGAITFTDATGVLVLHDPAAVSLAIDGVQQGDVIDLAGLSYSATDAVQFGSGILTIEQNGTVVADLTMADVEAGAVFGLISDGHGGSAVVLEGLPSGQSLVDTLAAPEVAALDDGLVRLTANVAQTQGLSGARLNVFTPGWLLDPQGVKVPGAVNVANGKPIAAGETITLGNRFQGIVLTGHRSAEIIGRAGNAFATAELLVGNAGDDTIRGGGGSGTVISGAGSNEIMTGKGNVVVNSGGSDTIDTGTGYDIIQAYGSATVHAGAGTTLFFDLGGAGGADKVRGGTGTARMYSGLGSDTFIGGSGLTDMVDTGHGNVAFQFNRGVGGTDIVSGFNAGAGDYIRVTANSWNATQILGHETIMGGNTFVELPDQTAIEFVGITNLTIVDFHA